MSDVMIIAATGHRPNKLGGYGPDAFSRLVYLASNYLAWHKPDGVISGMALGWDLAWASAAQCCGIPVHAAVPFQGQENQWPNASREFYRQTLALCTSVTIVCDGGYQPEKMQIRNQWMMDRCHRVCALFDGSYGGTGNCINYALKIGRPIDNLWTLYNN